MYPSVLMLYTMLCVKGIEAATFPGLRMEVRIVMERSLKNGSATLKLVQVI